MMFKEAEWICSKTPYGAARFLHSGEISGRKAIFLLRHGPKHSIPPHKINYKANVYALHRAGVERVLATNAVGAINISFKPGDIVIPHDFVDFTKLRSTSFYEEAPVTHIDVSQPFCPDTRRLLVEAAEKVGVNVWDEAVLVCTEGPRFETAAEIQMFQRLGCDVVGMTTIPEAVLSRELEMCYASISYVSNMAAGLQKRLTVHEVSRISKRIFPKIQEILIETIKALPTERNCPCTNALRQARLD